MPVYKRTIEYYTCQFKCGSPAKEKYKMEQHEKNCFCNPENKACRICANFNAQTHRSYCTVLELYIKNTEEKHPVYNMHDEIEWSEIRWHIFQDLDISEIELRPFPTKNCKHFILGKNNINPGQYEFKSKRMALSYGERIKKMCDESIKRKHVELICEDCNDSGYVKVSEFEYQECPCLKNKL